MILVFTVDCVPHEPPHERKTFSKIGFITAIQLTQNDESLTLCSSSPRPVDNLCITGAHLTVHWQIHNTIIGRVCAACSQELEHG